MCNYYVYIGTLLQKQFVHVKLCNFCHSNHAGMHKYIFTCKPVLNEHSIASRTLIPRSQTTEQLKSHNKFQQLSPQTSFQLKFIVHCWFLSPKRAKFSLYLMCLPVDRRFQFEYTKEFL